MIVGRFGRGTETVGRRGGSRCEVDTNRVAVSRWSDQKRCFYEQSAGTCVKRLLVIN